MKTIKRILICITTAIIAGCGDQRAEIEPGYPYRKTDGAHCARCTGAEPTHYTRYGTNGSAIFILCDPCWRVLSPETRWLYYERDMAQFEWPSAKREAVKRAVFANNPSNEFIINWKRE